MLNITITSVKDLTVMTANYQAMAWNNEIVPQPQLPSLDNFGWKLDDNKWLPVISTLPPASETVIQVAVRKRDVRPTDANVVKQIKSQLH